MKRIDAAMEELAALLAPHVSRLVTADPSRTSGAPCVLIGLPTFDATQLLCGSMYAEFPVLVIGQPGALAELGPLAYLLAETIEALEAVEVGYTRIQPSVYQLLTEQGTADPSQAYEITVERYV